MPFFAITSPSSGNATHLQGNPVAATGPATGSVLTFNGSSWTAADGVTGPTGPRGADAPKLYGGSGSPAAAFGAAGDFWVDNAGGVLYGPKLNGSWGSGLQLQYGPAGPTGPESTTPGPTGPTGAASSVPGPTGAASTVPGPTGPTGTRGATILAGDGPPLANYGSEGDWYLDLVGADFYGPKLSGSWGAPSVDLLAITGPTGPASTIAGPTGPASTIAGPTGATGGTEFYATATAPAANNAGALWLDTDNGRLFIRYGETFIETGTPGEPGPTGPASTTPGPTGPAGSLAYYATASAPETADAGAVWLDTDTGRTFYRYSDTWVQIYS